MAQRPDTMHVPGPRNDPHASVRFFANMARKVPSMPLASTETTLHRTDCSTSAPTATQNYRP